MLECVEKSDGTNQAFGQCATRTITDDEAKLNEIWNEMYPWFKKVHPQSHEALLTEQKNWVKFKDSACEYYLEGFGREGQTLHFGFCRSALLQERITYLNSLLDDLKRHYVK